MNLIFSRTAAQSAQKDFLHQALAGNTFPQTLLIHGSKGVGQSALLVDLAEILLCDSQEQRPCGSCPRCREWKNRNSDNLSCLFPHPDSQHKNRNSRLDSETGKWEAMLENPYNYFQGQREHISIDQIRDLTEKLSFAEISTRNRIVLIFGAESMFDPAANALLKILEEPPPRTHFLLSCENRAGLLPTILSRCVLLNLPRLSLSEMEQFIKSNAPESAISQNRELLHLSNGSPGTYLQMEINNGPVLLDQAKSFLENSVHRDWQSFSAFIENNPELENPEKCVQILNFVLEMLRLSLNNTEEDPGRDHTGPAFTAVLDQFKGDYRDFENYKKFVENCVSAISHYSKPSIALLGNFMDREITPV